MSRAHVIRSLRSVGRHLLLLASVAAAVVVPAGAAGQDIGLPTEPGFALGSGGGFEVYRFATPEAANIRQLSLLTVPWGARTPLIGPASIEVRGGYAAARLEPASGDEITLAGPLDTELQIGVPFGRRGFVATVAGVIVLPTGTASQTPEEAVVAGAIAADLFPFRIVNWGTGGGAGGSVGAVRSMKRGSVGLSVGYVSTREFEPIQDESTTSPITYRPGDMLHLRIAADRNIGGASKATIALSYEHHQRDEFDGVNLYGTGGRYQAMGSYAFAAAAGSSGVVYAGALYREQGDYRDDGGTAPASPEIPAQGLLLVGGGWRLPVRGTVLVPSVDSRVYRTEEGISGGHLTGLGAALELRLPAGWMVIPTGKLRYGSISVQEDRDSSIYGADLGVTVRFGSGVR
jgi:hypothetical protein